MIQLMLYVFAALAVVVGLIVLASNGRRLSNILAAAINGCIAVWCVTIAIFLSATSVEVVTVSAQIYYIAAGLFAALLLLLAFRLTNQAISTAVSVLIVLTAAAMSLAIMFVPQFIIQQAVVDGSPYIIVDPLTYLIYCLYFISLFVIGISTLIKSVRGSRGAKRSQYIAYCIGIAWMSIPGFITNLYLPYFQNYSLVWVGPFASILFLITISHGMVKHGLFDVRMAVARTLAYMFTLGSIVALYVLSVYFLSELFFSHTPLPQIFFNATITVALVLIFQPIKRFFDRVTNSLFYHNRYSRDEFYENLSSTLAKTTSLRQLLRQAATVIATTLSAKHVFFAVSNKGTVVSVGTKGRPRLAKDDFDWLTAWWHEDGNKDRSLVVRSRLEVGHMKRLLRSLDAEMVLALRQEDEVKGFVFIGNRHSERYTSRDWTVLETVADELTIAIQNALSVEEIRELNETLQQRVSAATKELRLSNAQLRKLDEAKDEFISMASHQLRTPLTSIKGYVDMILEGDAGEITPTQRKFLTEAFVSSERMVHLINDFLNVSRLQTGTFTIDKRPVDLAKIVGQELDSLAISASGRDLSFRYKKPKAFPMLLLDEDKIRQVIMNFADNALYYSQPATVIIVSLEADAKEVVFTVKDTGIGVPEEEQARLFTKFYRASNARKQRPDGTGVGLYLAKRVIMEHGGSVVFTSSEGKGSTFGFRLPLDRLRVRDDADKLDNQPNNH